ncbi:hypothetical protein Bbelb_107670 [Branchiostoma belcheri]|nr:hypothetical protein Bbelb_107670 [Branchiostoma belcheri]
MRSNAETTVRSVSSTNNTAPGEVQALLTSSVVPTTSSYDFIKSNATDTQWTELATMTPPTSTLTISTALDKLQSNKHRDSDSSFSLTILIGSISGTAVATALVVTTIFITIWYKKKKRAKNQGPNNTHVSSSTDTTTAVAITDHVESGAITESSNVRDHPLSNRSNEPPPLPPPRKGVVSTHESNSAAACGTPHHYQPLRKTENVNGHTDAFGYLILVPNAGESQAMAESTNNRDHSLTNRNNEPPPLPPSRKGAAAVHESNKTASCGTSHHYQPLRKTENVNGHTDAFGYLILVPNAGESQAMAESTNNRDHSLTNRNNEPPPLPPSRKGAAAVHESNITASCGTSHHYQPLTKTENVNGPTDAHGYLILVPNAENSLAMAESTNARDPPLSHRNKLSKDEPPPPLPPRKRVH